MRYRSLYAVIVLSAAGVLSAQPATRPATQPTKPAAAPAVSPAEELADKEAAAIAAFDAGDYAGALSMLKDVSVRLRNDPDRVAPLLERIRVCEANIAQVEQPIEGINAPRTAHPTPKAGQVYELELQKLGNFNYDAERGGGIPDDVAALSGSTVKLKGYMIPVDEAEKITKFVLVPDLFACCFGQPPSLQHTAVVVCPPGKAVSYYPEEIWVVGQLKVDEKRDEGFVVSIFEVNATSIRPIGD